MASPDFLCIGAQKAGTTWLYQMLRSHRQVWLPPVKELQFLNELYRPERFRWAQRHREVRALAAINWHTSRAAPDYHTIELLEHIAQKPDSFDWYERVFDFAPAAAVKGELTPEYSLLSAESVASVAKRYPHLKIILLLRDPVERAKSSLVMRAVRQADLLEDPVALNAAVLAWATEPDGVERGDYASIIKRWSNLFPENSLLVLLNDELRSMPEACLARVSALLGIERDGFSADPIETIHQGARIELAQEAMTVIENAQAKNREWYEQNKERFSVRQGH